jgi:hypothetical protein
VVFRLKTIVIESSTTKIVFAMNVPLRLSQRQVLSLRR